MKTALDYKAEILALQSEAGGPSDYGSRVMPVLSLYKRLGSYAERKTFQDALELLLRSEIESERTFGVDVCLGFFVFRDAIE